jgi:hypothetical protein
MLDVVDVLLVGVPISRIADGGKLDVGVSRTADIGSGSVVNEGRRSSVAKIGAPSSSPAVDMDGRLGTAR